MGLCAPREKRGWRADGKKKNSRWAKMLARVFKIDVLRCEKCNGDLRPVCALTAPQEVARYLAQQGLLPEVARAPPKARELVFSADGA